MKYKILTNDKYRWGEGWQYGDIVEMDDAAAIVPLKNGEIMKIGEDITTPATNIVEEKFKCIICDRVCKNQLGLQAHMRSHK